jgi:hypothetical protein
MISGYEEMFAERGGVAPTDPLKFHLYSLARYWSRLVGFCRQTPSSPEGWIDGDLGACVQGGSEFAHKLITPDSPLTDFGKTTGRRPSQCFTSDQSPLTPSKPHPVLLMLALSS